MKTTAIALLIFLGTCVPCNAGTTGVLNGYVRDATGNPAPNTVVDAYSSSAAESVHTDRRGFFAFVNLPPDVYEVYTQDGGRYAMYSVGVRVNSDQTAFVTFRFYQRMVCGPIFSPVSAGVDQRGQQFTSLNLRQMSHYPPGVSIPAPMLPSVASQRHGVCL